MADADGEPTSRPRRGTGRSSTPLAARLIQLGCLITAAVVAAVFLMSQQQTADIRYGATAIDDGSGNADDGGSGGGGDAGSDGGEQDQPGRGSATLPPDGQWQSLLAGDTRIVRLPGATAEFDEPAVLAALERTESALRAEESEPDPDSDAGSSLPIKVVLAPPGLSEEDSKRFYELAKDHVRVEGLDVSFRAGAEPGTAAEWARTFATGEVTTQILTLLARAAGEPAPAAPDGVEWREPTGAELDTVLAGISGDRWHAFPDATLHGIPEVAATAFGDTEPPIVVALPQQPFGEPVPDYATALAAEYPDTPIMVMYGYWIEFAGPFDADLVDLATAGYFGTYDSVLLDRVWPQRNGLRLYLEQWKAMRLSGMFDRPLPFVPPDPLGIALPALPWVFLGCVVLIAGVTWWSLRRKPPPERPGSWSRMARLSALAIEASPLADGDAAVALTRGITLLGEAQRAKEHRAPPQAVDGRLQAAEKEFAAMAAAMGRPDYRPQQYTAAATSQQPEVKSR